ncbi:MAG: PhoH family protein [Thermodesulfovibrionales bacterium]|nr:PhoH family protein [Thermodesulfovibrionales bacterium]
MKKTFILDTNVLIHDPLSLFKFDNNHIVIPFVVIEELDRLKKGHGEIAISARHALRILDSLREGGSLSKGVMLENGGIISIYNISSDEVSCSLDIGIDDNKIILTALSLKNRQLLQDNYNHSPVIIVSKDTAVRIKAESLNIQAEDYKHDKTSLFQQYGRVLTSEDNTNGVYSVRYLQADNNLYKISGLNEYRIIRKPKEVSGIEPKNIEQVCAIDALTDPEIEIVALIGAAGTGKTLLALAAGIYQTAQLSKKTSIYEQVIVSRPVIPMGYDIGYLPGDVEEKLRPWMQPIFDNLEVIINTPRTNPKDKTSHVPMKSYQYLIDAGLLQIEPLTYIRGRSLPKRYFIIDEAQNLRPIDIKTIVTRCGEGTKIVFTGDLDQIDTPYLDKMSNGLAYLISRFINEENFCFLNLKQSVRSKLSEQGARLL